ncbi:MAG: sodium-dependent transporter [Bacillota bacterium]|uniref:sodium-dependent transporter n=1 Tax=Thermanaerosceptrum fracticalcis TaxID=1712410 RepID=UPI000AF0BD5F|nr:sodium-dependent transporter [Thermanaerosceptrum fracticalcis]
MSIVQKEQHKPREGFATSLGVITATLGSAVGLGNIWKFPYMTGENGGAAFILVYLLCVILVGLPVMISELIIGRTTQANAITAFKRLAPNRPWYLVGVSGTAASFLIMAFYTTVAGWVFSYIFKAASGVISTTDPEVTTQVFKTSMSAVWSPLLWQWFVLLFTGSIIMLGVTKGIERITKTLMPILFLLLLICVIRALTLPGASEGLKFLFRPDFSKITGATILTAMGLSFFKLSVGMGTMITYGSYFGFRENIPYTAVKVMLSDTLVSILAGMAIFPAVFAFGFKPDAGPSLLFITIPTVFASMPLGNIFMVLFFLLVSIAATGAMISLLEVPVAYFTEELKWSRLKATLVTIISIALVGTTATLSFSTLGDTKFFDKTFFDLYDFLTSNILLPVGGLLITYFIAWKWGLKNIAREASNNGSLSNQPVINIYFFIVRYLAPIAITLILLNGLGFIKI